MDTSFMSESWTNDNLNMRLATHGKINAAQPGHEINW
jgi:hypothetical protein